MADPRPHATVLRPRAMAALRRAADRIGWLGLGVAGLAWPAAALGATPEMPPGEPVEVPAIGLVDQLLPILGPVVGIAVIGAVAVGLAVVVARLGGRPGAARDAGWSRRRTAVAGGVALGALILGIAAGREIAHERSAGMFLAGLIPGFLLAASIGGLGLVGLLALAIRRGRPNLAVGMLLLAAIALAVGAVGGERTASATGGTVVEPVVLRSAGTATLTLPTGDTTFVARADAVAECTSLPDGRAVGQVTALDLGELGPGTMRGTLALPTSGPDGATIELWIDGADIADGSDQPSWTGPVVASGLDPDARNGSATFSAVAREADQASKGGPTDASPARDAWPGTLEGSVSWSCRPW